MFSYVSLFQNDIDCRGIIFNVWFNNFIWFFIFLFFLQSSQCPYCVKYCLVVNYLWNYTLDLHHYYYVWIINVLATFIILLFMFIQCFLEGKNMALIASFMGPTWGPSGADRTQVGPMLAPWTLLSGVDQPPSDIDPYYYPAIPLPK